MGMGRSSGVAVFVGVVIFLGAPFAPADVQRKPDPPDNPSALDIQWIQHSHRTSPKGKHQLVHTIRTYGPWRKRILERHGKITLEFDLRGNSGNPPERSIWIDHKNGRLRAIMYRTLGDPPARLVKLPVWRPDRHTIKVAFAPRWLRTRDLSFYRWAASVSLDSSHPSCTERFSCNDRAPDGGTNRRYFHHQIEN
jgi:hypothetical protein